MSSNTVHFLADGYKNNRPSDEPACHISVQLQVAGTGCISELFKVLSFLRCSITLLWHALSLLSLVVSLGAYYYRWPAIADGNRQ
jgi:hypothetical protein